MRKCYFCCGCYKFYCCRCCECTTCCSCIPISECCKIKDDLSEINNEGEKICVIYKIKGCCSYICDYFTDFAFMFLAISLIYVKLLNFGFNITLNKYINKKEKDELEYGKLNLTSLGGIILYYLLNIILGYLFSKKLPFQDVKKTESSFVGYGVIPLLYFINLFCLLFSILTYYNIINETSQYYLMSLSRSGVEYYYLMITYFVIGSYYNNNDGIEILSYSAFASLLLLIYKGIIYLLENLEISEKTLILIQYIINIFSFLIQTCHITCMYISVRMKGIKTNEDFINKDKESQDLVIKKKQRLKELEKKYEEEIDETVRKEITSNIIPSYNTKYEKMENK